MSDGEGTLGIVVLTHGRGQEVRDLLANLRQEGVPLRSVVVVHNPASHDAPSLELPDPRPEVVRLSHNQGYVGGMNAGLRRQLERGVERIGLVTHDVRFRKGALAAIQSAFDSGERFGVLGPALVDPRTDHIFSYGAHRFAPGALAHRHTPPRIENGIAPADSIDGAAFFVRAAAARTVGLLDERFFMYFEESEWCLRMKRAGWQVGVVVDALAEQEPGAARRPGSYGYLMARNGLEYARREGGAPGVASTVWRQLVDSAGAVRALVRPRTVEPVSDREGARVLAGWVGVLAFALRRWGPPPSFLPGVGDMRATRPPRRRRTGRRHIPSMARRRSTGTLGGTDGDSA